MNRNLRFIISTRKLHPYLACLFLMCIFSLHTTEFSLFEIQSASAEAIDPDLVLYFDYEDFDGDRVVDFFTILRPNAVGLQKHGFMGLVG